MVGRSRGRLARSGGHLRPKWRLKRWAQPTSSHSRGNSSQTVRGYEAFVAWARVPTRSRSRVRVASGFRVIRAGAAFAEALEARECRSRNAPSSISGRNHNARLKTSAWEPPGRIAGTRLMSQHGCFSPLLVRPPLPPGPAGARGRKRFFLRSFDIGDSLLLDRRLSGCPATRSSPAVAAREHGRQKPEPSPTQLNLSQLPEHPDRIRQGFDLRIPEMSLCDHIPLRSHTASCNLPSLI